MSSSFWKGRNPHPIDLIEHHTNGCCINGRKKKTVVAGKGRIKTSETANLAVCLALVMMAPTTTTMMMMMMMMMTTMMMMMIASTEEGVKDNVAATKGAVVNADMRSRSIPSPPWRRGANRSGPGAHRNPV